RARAGHERPARRVPPQPARAGLRVSERVRARADVQLQARADAGRRVRGIAGAAAARVPWRGRGGAGGILRRTSGRGCRAVGLSLAMLPAAARTIRMMYRKQARAAAGAAGIEAYGALASCWVTNVSVVAGDLAGGIASGRQALAVFERHGNLWCACRTLWGLS